MSLESGLESLLICAISILKSPATQIESRSPDVGFPSVCCECAVLPLVNKEAALGLWKGRTEEGGNSKQR